MNVAYSCAQINAKIDYILPMKELFQTRSHAIQLMIQLAMMSYWVVLPLFVILLTMVQIIFAIETVIIKMVLHFLQVVLNILPTMTIHHITYKIDPTTVKFFHHLIIITIILDHKNHISLWINRTITLINSPILKTQMHLSIILLDTKLNSHYNKNQQTTTQKIFYW